MSSIVDDAKGIAQNASETISQKAQEASDAFAGTSLGQKNKEITAAASQKLQQASDAIVDSSIVQKGKELTETVLQKAKNASDDITLFIMQRIKHIVASINFDKLLEGIDKAEKEKDIDVTMLRNFIIGLKDLVNDEQDKKIK